MYFNYTYMLLARFFCRSGVLTAFAGQGWQQIRRTGTLWQSSRWVAILQRLTES